jgi:chromosomal replication initiation ATPase DnaA
MSDRGHIWAAVCAEYGVKEADVRGKGRKRPLPEARAMVAYVMQVKEGLGRKEVALEMGVHPASVLYFWQTISDFKRLYRDTREHFENILKALEKCD